MKQICKVILIISVFSGATIPLNAQTFSAQVPSGQTLYFTPISDSTVSVTSNYHKMNGALVIPDSINGNDKKYKVSSIESYAFSDDTTLSEVTIPYSIDEIKQCPFHNCTNITTVHYNAYCPTVYGGSEFAIFNNCIKISTVIFGDSIAWVPAWLFNNCPLISTINIPDSCTAIGILAFRNCTGLKRISFGSKMTLSMTNAFWGCDSLNVVDYRGTLSDWFRIRFKYENSQPLSFADSLLLSDTLLTDIVIPAEIDSINDYALYHYSSLHSVMMHDSIFKIGDFAFSECRNLTSVTLPNAECEIGQYAFAQTSLTELTIPPKTKKINMASFFSNSLSTVYYNATDATLGQSYTGPFAMRIPGTDSVAPISSFIIGENVESLPQQILWNDTSIHSICIPSNVTRIGSQAFKGCIYLRTLTLLPVVPPTIYFNTFEEIPTILELIVPCGTSDTYHNSPYWNVFQNITEDCSSIEDVNTITAKIYQRNGQIIVESDGTLPVRVFDMTGRIMAHSPSTDSGEEPAYSEQVIVAVPTSGIYLVKIGDTPARKVVVIK